MERNIPRMNRAGLVILPVVVVLVISLLVTAGCIQTAPASPAETEGSGYMVVAPAQAKELIDKNPDLIIIDISSSSNYAKGHLPGSVNYDFGEGSLDRAIPTLDKNGTYLVYCRVDNTAIKGAKELVGAGFGNVYRLAGNYKAWVDAGYLIEK